MLLVHLLLGGLLLISKVILLVKDVNNLVQLGEHRLVERLEELLERAQLRELPQQVSLGRPPVAFFLDGYSVEVLCSLDTGLNILYREALLDLHLAEFIIFIVVYSSLKAIILLIC